MPARSNLDPDPTELADMNAKRHLIIAGTGRAGTSLLVSLFGELGLDTGQDRLRYFPEANAGWEVRLPDPRAPYVVKDHFIDLRQLFQRGSLHPDAIDALLIPIRNLDQAALSRKHRSVNNLLSNGTPGGLTGTRNPWRQQAVLASRVYRQIEAAAEYEVPVTLMAYPRFAQDVDYAYRHLAPLVGVCDPHTFAAAWHRVVDLSLVRDQHLRDSLWLNMALLTKAIALRARRVAKRIPRQITRH